MIQRPLARRMPIAPTVASDATPGTPRLRSAAAAEGQIDKPAPTCLWMKGMEFPLDIVWLNGSRQVVYLQQNVLPNTYPKNFCPPTAAKYIIELNAGQVKALGIQTAQTLRFK